MAGPQVVTAEGSFEDVKFGLNDAIINRGLKVIYKGNIAQMLERTGGAVKGARKIYDNAEFFLFCSAPHSHGTMQADPANIAYCPYSIFIYTLVGEKDKVHVGYRRPSGGASEASKKALAGVETLLKAIIKETVE